MTIRVVIADDQGMVRSGFSVLLNAQPDIEVVSARMHIVGVRVRADLLVDEQAGDQAADDAQLAHQCTECHRDGQAYRLDLLGLLR